jgi:hypothetical protein
MSVRYKGVVFDRDGSKYEVGSQEQTVLNCILLYYSVFSNVMFDIRAYIDNSICAENDSYEVLYTLYRIPCLCF